MVAESLHGLRAPVPGTREHFLNHLARNWPKLLDRYSELYRRPYLDRAPTEPIRTEVAALKRTFAIADRCVAPLAPDPQPEQLGFVGWGAIDLDGGLARPQAPDARQRRDFIRRSCKLTVVTSRSCSAIVWQAALSMMTAAASPAVRSASAQAAGPVRYTVVPERSEARYRIREQLAGVNFPNDAVGTTRAIDGGIAFDVPGRVVAGQSRFSVDLRTLTSAQPPRDNFTVRTVMRRTTWQATATFNGAEVDVWARTAFRFADHGLQIPRVASVLSVEDNIRLELDLVLRRSS